eukprot:365319-Chlamydomonas_euryale.AAC.21
MTPTVTDTCLHHPEAVTHTCTPCRLPTSNTSATSPPQAPQLALRLAADGAKAAGSDVPALSLSAAACSHTRARDLIALFAALLEPFDHEVHPGMTRLPTLTEACTAGRSAAGAARALGDPETDTEA